MAGVNFDTIGSAYVPSVNLTNGHDKLIENMLHTNSIIDSIFKDKRSLDEKNDATIKDRNTAEIEMKLASGEIKPEDLAGMSDIYMDSTRIMGTVDKMATQDYNAQVLQDNIDARNDRVAAAKIAAQTLKESNERADEATRVKAETVKQAREQAAEVARVLAEVTEKKRVAQMPVTEAETAAKKATTADTIFGTELKEEARARAQAKLDTKAYINNPSTSIEEMLALKNDPNTPSYLMDTLAEGIKNKPSNEEAIDRRLLRNSTGDGKEAIANRAEITKRSMGYLQQNGLVGDDGQVLSAKSIMEKTRNRVLNKITGVGGVQANTNLIAMSMNAKGRKIMSGFRSKNDTDSVILEDSIEANQRVVDQMGPGTVKSEALRDIKRAEILLEYLKNGDKGVLKMRQIKLGKDLVDLKKNTTNDVNKIISTK